MTTDPPADRSADPGAAPPVAPDLSEPEAGRVASSTKALLAVLLAGIAGLVVLLFVHTSKDGAIRPGPAPAQAACPKGQRDCLPDVSYIDTTGAAYSRESLAGKVVLVNFWATWCQPCEKEIPDLSRMYDKYRSRGVVFLGVLIDNPDSQKLLNFQSDHNMTYPVVRSNPQLIDSYGEPDGYPTTMVYDRHGKQAYRHLGMVSETELDRLLATLIGQS